MNLKNLPIQMTKDWITYDLLVDITNFGSKKESKIKIVKVIKAKVNHINSEEFLDNLVEEHREELIDLIELKVNFTADIWKYEDTR